MKGAEKYIKLLIHMLAIPSLSKQEETRAGFLEKWLTTEGFVVERMKNNLIVTKKGYKKEDASILLNSHIDTVPPGEGWNSDPFLPLARDGKIIGLGSNDAGSSVVALIAAFEDIVQKNLNKNAVLVLSAEEEISGKNGISSLLKYLPNLKFAIVGEPTDMNPSVAERGLMVIDALAHGTSGHAAQDEGKNAIYEAISDIQNIKDIQFTDHSEWLKDPSINVTMIHAGSGHNVVPGKCEFVIDVRSNDKYSNERLLEMLNAVCASELKARSMRLRSSCLNQGHPVYSLLGKLGLTPFGSPTLSDMALMQLPSLKIGPGDSSRSHTANEFIMEHEIPEAIDIYKNLLGEIVKLEL